MKLPTIDIEPFDDEEIKEFIKSDVEWKVTLDAWEPPWELLEFIKENQQKNEPPLN